MNSANETVTGGKGFGNIMSIEEYRYRTEQSPGQTQTAGGGSGGGNGGDEVLEKRVERLEDRFEKITSEVSDIKLTLVRIEGKLDAGFERVDGSLNDKFAHIDTKIDTKPSHWAILGLNIALLVLVSSVVGLTVTVLQFTPSP